MYQQYLLGRLKATMMRKLDRHKDFPLPVSKAQILALKTIREFDDLLTAPLHGFHNADDYYQKSSGKAFLKQVRIPLLLVHAKDDPFLSPAVLPKADEIPPFVQLILSRHGGHVGFVTGNTPFKAEYWLEQQLPPYLAQFLGQH